MRAAQTSADYWSPGKVACRRSANSPENRCVPLPGDGRFGIAPGAWLGRIGVALGCQRILDFQRPQLFVDNLHQWPPPQAPDRRSRRQSRQRAPTCRRSCSAGTGSFETPARYHCAREFGSRDHPVDSHCGRPPKHPPTQSGMGMGASDKHQFQSVPGSTGIIARSTRTCGDMRPGRCQ